MKINLKDLIIGLLVLLVLVVLYMFIEENRRNRLLGKINRRLTKENDELRKAYLDLLQQHLLLSEETPLEIIKDIERLKEESIELNRDVHIELGSVIDNVRNNKGPKAVRELGKIIENLLKQRASTDEQFKKKPTLSNLLDHALKFLWIKPNEHAYAELVRDIRNRESHELNVEIEPHKIGLAIYAGIDIIYSICKSLKHKEVSNNGINPVYMDAELETVEKA